MSSLPLHILIVEQCGEEHIWKLVHQETKQLFLAIM